ncbi:TRAP transporter small permease [Zobellella aerophila]|uniref:TRAP transporter small permease protein n=1 Tax=Zobellella aerophila TaxID=870480 RepID=A0ABP6VTZ1_9GAMM
MKFLTRLNGTIEHSLTFIAGSSLFAMMLLTFADVVGRNLFNHPIVGAIELLQVLLALMLFSAFPLVTWKEEHICVDLLDSRFPARWVNLRQLAINLLCAVALGLVAMRNWELAGRSLDYQEMTDMLGIPLGYVTYFIAVMGGLAALLTLGNGILYLLGGGRLPAALTENGG